MCIRDRLRIGRLVEHLPQRREAPTIAQFGVCRLPATEHLGELSTGVRLRFAAPIAELPEDPAKPRDDTGRDQRGFAGARATDNAEQLRLGEARDYPVDVFVTPEEKAVLLRPEGRQPRIGITKGSRRHGGGLAASAVPCAGHRCRRAGVLGGAGWRSHGLHSRAGLRRHPATMIDRKHGRRKALAVQARRRPGQFLSLIHI